jgi:hypothetical protein
METNQKLLMQELEKLVKERDLLKKRLENAEILMDSLKEDNEDLQRVFDITWKADMRAIRLWRKATKRNFVMLDRCDMVIYLMDELDNAKRKIRELERMIVEK